jgi:peptide/nickel transport system substrate-binding protein
MTALTRRDALWRIGAGMMCALEPTLAGCARVSGDEPARDGHAGAPAPPRRGGTLVFATAGDVSGLDPQNDRGIANTLAEQQMFESFYRFRSGSTEIEPALAEWHEISPDARSISLRLRAGLRFHDGTPLDAAAVKFAMEVQAYPDHPLHRGGAYASWSAHFGPGHPGRLERIVVLDSRTLRFELREPFVNLLYAMADPTTAAINPNVLGRDPEGWGKRPRGAGAGPFQFEEWRPGERLVFTRSEHYWEADRPLLDRLIFRPLPDPAVRLLALRTGEVDVSEVQGSEVRILDRDPLLRVVRGQPGPATWIGFNHQDPVLRDRRVRLAVSQALDRASLVKQLWPETAIVAESHGLSPGMEGFRDDLTWYPYDPAAARELLVAAGHRAGLSLTMSFNRELTLAPDAVALAEAIQAQLAQIGIRLALEQEDRTTFFTSSRANPETGAFPYQMVLNGTANRGDSFLYLRVWQNWTNYGFVHDRYRALGDRAALETDMEARKAIYGEMQEMLREDVGFVPLAWSQSALACRREVHGLVAPFGGWPIYFKDVWLEAAPARPDRKT